jgi:hypothetical protein
MDSSMRGEISPFSRHGAQCVTSYGFIDEGGNIAVQPAWCSVRNFAEGLAAVQQSKNSSYKWGYINRSGNVVIEPKWHSAQSFSEGLALVDRRAFIDKAGKVVIEDPSTQGESFHHGLALDRSDGSQENFSRDL